MGVFQTLDDLNELKNVSEEGQKLLHFFSEQKFKIQLFHRTGFDLHQGPGILGFFLDKAGQSFFLAFTNAKCKAGTFAQDNLDYLHDFLDQIEKKNKKSPLVFVFHSGGVRITESRRIYNSIWGVLPRLFWLRRQRLFITLAYEKCIGAAALFFGQGHLRIACSKDTVVNLTGPGVIKRFYGREDNFKIYSSAKHLNERHFLVQEVAAHFDGALARTMQILNFAATQILDPVSHVNNLEYQTPTSEWDGHFYRQTSMEELLKAVSDSQIEILSNMSAAGRTYLCLKDKKKWGLLINPLNHPVNSISVKTIEHYYQALQIFKAMELPLISVIDSPGGDPRQQNSDQDIISKTLNLVEALVDYPYKKMGLIAGRCFGGSGVLSLPVVHGSMGLYAMENSKLGIMSDEVIESITKSNEAAYGLWKNTQASHKADFSDLIQAGVIKKVLDTAELSLLMDDFLR